MPLSIGLEFEAVILSLTGDRKIPVKTYDQLSIISDAISRVGLNARPYMPTTTRAIPNYTIWNVVVDGTIQEATSQSDTSESAFQNRFGVELVSPTFFDTDKDGWKKEVKAALHGVAASVAWKANRSTGLHVHIGRGRDVQFTLPELQRLAMLVCCFEDALDTLRPHHRVNYNENIVSNRFNALLKNLPLDKVYARIQEVTDVRQLVQVMNFVSQSELLENAYDGYHDSKFFKVNFTSLLKHDTVEFRQHEGTVDGNSAVKWAEFILRFVQFAIDSTDEVIMRSGHTRDHLAALVRLP